ncbi:hypothetical protein [Amycolatopsis sp. NPDC004625]|uniref:hypothetical protein n=1 Tax=Amycolatopsis sp. NPDC004625 TaxID=3154670 RepID=UPI0033B36EC8
MALVAGLVLLLVEGGLDQGDKIASIVSMVIAGISLPITVYTVYVSARQERQATVSEPGRAARCVRGHPGRRGADAVGV